MGGFAWVTLATNDSYSLGALVLAHSLKQAGTVHQLAILITPGVTRAMREKLETVFNVVKEVNVLDSRDEANLRLLKRPELGVTFTKLHCWTLTQFDKCVFLDADTLVLQNSDELFERDEFSAAPDVGWPDCFNSGVFVYRPSAQTYESLIQFALDKGSFDGGDQGLLNLYFSDWAHKDISKHLPFIYNMCSTACYSYLPAFKQFGSNAKIMHFIGSQKPWLQYFNTETRKVQPSGDASHLEGVLQRWWDIFCSLIHPELSPAMAGLAGAFSQLTLGVARTAEQDALENVLRKQAWEVGNIDYLGKDSFENIWSKITETLSSGPIQATAAPTPEDVVPSAPAESQSQTVPQQETQSSDKISSSIDKIESSSVQEETKTPEAQTADNVCAIKPAAATELLTCPMIPEPNKQEPLICPLIQPEKQPEVPVTSTVSSSPLVPEKIESPPVVAKDEITEVSKPPITTLIAASNIPLQLDTPKEPPQTVAETSILPTEPSVPILQTKSQPIPLKDLTSAPIEQPPASVISPLIPQEETSRETMVPKEQPRVSRGSIGSIEQPLPTPVTLKEPLQVLPEPEKQPLPAPVTPKEQPQPILAPVTLQEQAKNLTEPVEQPPVKSTEQSSTKVSVPAEQPPLAPLVAKEQLAPPTEQTLTTPPVTTPVSCELKPATPKPIEPVELCELQETKKPDDKPAKQDKPDVGVAEPVSAEADVAKGVSKAQTAASPSKDKPEGSKEAAKGTTPTPPPRKTDKPKKGASKAKK